MRIKHRDSAKTFGGIAVLRAWEPGVIPEFIGAGYSLADAQELAIANNAWRDTYVAHNLWTTLGQYFLLDMLIATETLGLTYHAVGTGTNAPALGDTQLQTEYVRTAFSLRQRNTLEITVSAFYPAVTIAINIKELGIFGGASASGTPNSGKLYSRVALTYNNAASPADLTFDYLFDIVSA